MTYADIIDWVDRNFEMNNYFSAEELLYDVEDRFNRDKKIFPEQARDLIREKFLNLDYYTAQKIQQEEDQMVADMLGSGQVPQSLTDEIIRDLRQPEIMGIDISEYSTTKEAVLPPPIVRFAPRPNMFINRIKTWFGRLFRRGE